MSGGELGVRAQGKGENQGGPGEINPGVAETHAGACLTTNCQWIQTIDLQASMA